MKDFLYTILKYKLNAVITKHLTCYEYWQIFCAVLLDWYDRHW